ncbi:unnamed protein product [Absidia cylindrospora]
MGSISRKCAVSKLSDMVVPIHQENINQVVLCLILKLPMDPIGEEMNESEHSSRYAEPFLSGLFEDPDHDIFFFRWTNENTMEAALEKSAGCMYHHIVGKAIPARPTDN